MEYIIVKGEDMSDKNLTSPSFPPTCWHTNYQQHKKATQKLSPSLEAWAILAPLQYHPHSIQAQWRRQRSTQPSSSFLSLQRRGHCWVRTVPTAGNNSSTFKMCHQGGQPLAGRDLMLCLAKCGFFLMFSSLHFKLCSSKKKMRKT